jgi:hypothetical protein
MLGTAFSYGYMWLLCQDVDSVKGTDIVPYWEADKVRKAVQQQQQQQQSNQQQCQNHHQHLC